MKTLETVSNVIGGLAITLTGFAIVYGLYAIMSGAWLS